MPWIEANVSFNSFFDRAATNVRVRGCEAQFTMAMQAVLAGVGIAAAQPLYITDALATGRLVAPFPIVATKKESWYLEYRPGRADDPALVAFRDYVTSIARAPTPEVSGNVHYLRRDFGLRPHIIENILFLAEDRQKRPKVGSVLDALLGGLGYDDKQRRIGNWPRH